ncbi:MAG: hypothetical protein R3C61_04755 [Bacteroidia bacterium]
MIRLCSLLTTSLWLLYAPFVFAQVASTPDGAIGVNIETQMSDSWELTGNMTIHRTHWRGDDNNQDMVFQASGLTYDKVLAEAVDNLRIPEVELAGFSIKLEDRQVEIQWSSPVVPQISAFGVERSSDGVNWEKIGVLQVKTKETTLTDFSFTDQSPLFGTSYYRLRQEYKKKKVNFSDVIALENLPAGWHTTYLYPNPLIFGTAIELFLYKPAMVRIVIDDPTGNPIGTVYSRLTSIGSHQVELQMDDLPGGEYICRISVGDQLSLRKIRK